MTAAPGAPSHDARFDLALGEWGPDATADDRVAVALLYRPLERAFALIDARTRPLAQNATRVGNALDGAVVAGSPFEDVTLAVVEAIMLQDARVTALWEAESA